MVESDSLKALRELEDITSSLLPILEEISELKKLVSDKRYQEITKKLENY